MSCTSVDQDGGEDPESCREDLEIAATEKLACDLCRQRKTKCNRINPCSQCIKTRSQCTYQLGKKVRAKRQRILISSAYENRMEHISRQVDNLSEMLRQLNHAHSSISGVVSSSSAGTQPQPPSRPHDNPRVPGGDRHAGIRRSPPLNETESIESTLFSHVIFATKFVQTAVENDSSSSISVEMTQALDDLRNLINIQNQQNQTSERSNPFSKVLTPGMTFQDLPLPPLDQILACLRFAQERSPTHLYWPFELGSLGDFTQYVIKACSPGPVTDMELIIVLYGLYTLFIECASAAGDVAAKQEQEAQALICRDSLETILSNLSIHISEDIDSVCAMYLAALYCFHRGKLFASWTFISRASLMSQALGLHSNQAIIPEPEQEDAQRKTRLFWALYVFEKAMSLRLGRPSTIRDCYITVPRPRLSRTMTSILHNRLPDWVDVASLYSRVYDEIYSPSALTQPSPIRESRIRALGAEFERIMAARREFYKQPSQWTTHAIPPIPLNFIIHANLTTDLSILSSIYRGIPTDPDSRLSPSPECLSAARATLKEAEWCTNMLADAAQWSPILDTWVTEVFLLAPFMPFLILFCNVVETADRSDLARLQRLVGGLQSMVQFPRFASCKKQLRILSALYEVVAKYVEVQGSVGSSGELVYDDTYLSGGADSLSPSLFTVPEKISTGVVDVEEGDMDQVTLPSQIPDEFTELDPSRVQLESWLHQSHQMMRLLDDFY